MTPEAPPLRPLSPPMSAQLPTADPATADQPHSERPSPPTTTSITLRGRCHVLPHAPPTLRVTPSGQTPPRANRPPPRSKIPSLPSVPTVAPRNLPSWPLSQSWPRWHCALTTVRLQGTVLVVLKEWRRVPVE